MMRTVSRSSGVRQVGDVDALYVPVAMKKDATGSNCVYMKNMVSLI
jgi:hypothetical protein